MKPYDKNHPHNAVFCEQLQSVIDGKPKTAEYKVGDGAWQQLSMNKQGVLLADWLVSCNYRIKPPEPVMVTRTVTYPAPMAVRPALGAEYFVTFITGIQKNKWSWLDIDECYLRAGVCHLTREAAQEQWDAYYGEQK